MPTRSILFAGCALAASALLGCSREPAADTQTPLQLTLYSIDGRDFKPGEEPQTAEKLYGYPVLGKVEITAADQRKLIFATLQEGMARSDGTMAMCFWPRHAIRTLENGRTVDYVICFKCLQLEMHAGDSTSTKPITRDPQPVFNKLLQTAGIPLAPSMGGEEK